MQGVALLIWGALFVIALVGIIHFDGLWETLSSLVLFGVAVFPVAVAMIMISL